MNEHVHEWMVSSVGGVYLAICNSLDDDGNATCEAQLTSKEIDERLSAHDPPVETCANWLEMSMVRGGDCYNCVNRNGFPMRGRPSKNCENYADILEGK